MNWKLKVIAFYFFETMPFGSFFYRQMQVRVTKRLPRSLNDFVGTRQHCLDHYKNFKEFYGDISKARYFEFGAGWDLANNLLMWSLGVNKQIIVDVVPLARPEYINHAIKMIQGYALKEFTRLPENLVTENFITEIKEYYGIEYYAPGDARNIPVEANSIDLVATTSTLEHIPTVELNKIIEEIHRVCHAGSVVSMQISYNDHYAHTDQSITAYNYMKFSKFQWSWLNPKIHYQNRLREVDFKKMFAEHNFSLIKESAIIPESAKVNLSKIQLHEDFQGYDEDDLLKTYGNLVYQTYG